MRPHETESTNASLEEYVTDYTVATMGHLSSMYKSVVKPPRNSHGSQHMNSTELLAKVRGGV